MTIDATTKQLLEVLHRGGQYGYWWTMEGRQSFWWEVGKMTPLPNGRRNVYFGVHPTTVIPETNPRQERKPARELRAQLPIIAALNCLYTEFDAKDFGGDKAQVRMAADALQPPPSVLIDSGGGYHLYWLFDEPLILETDEQREHAKRLQAAWVAYAGGDKAVKDLARVLRVPGTKNYKYDPAPDVSYVYANLDRRYTADTLEAICGHLMEDPTLPASAGVGQTPSDDPDMRYARGALDREVANVLRAPAGMKHDVIRNSALKLGTLAARGLLADDDIIDELTRAANVHRADVSDTYRTALDGLAYGKARPRDPSSLPSGKPRQNGAYQRASAQLDYHDSPAPDAIARAVARIVFQLYRMNDLRTLPPVEWLYPHEIPAGLLTVLCGPSEAGKSFLALHYAMSIARANADRMVVYVAPEGGGGYLKRCEAWLEQHGGGQPENLVFVLRSVPILDTHALHDFIATVKPHNPILVVLDTLARCIVGGDENSSKDVGMFVLGCDEIRQETGTAVMIVHHTGKSGNYRGSSALYGAADSWIDFANDDGLITVSCGKAKDWKPFEPRYLRMVERGESVVLLPAEQVSQRGAQLTEGQRKVLETLALDVFQGPGAKAAQIMNTTGIPEKTLFRILSHLKRSGMVSQGSRGDPYTITGHGLNQIKAYHRALRESRAGEQSTQMRDTDAQLSQLSPSVTELSTDSDSSVSHCHPPLYKGGVTVDSDSSLDSRRGGDELFPDDTPQPSQARAEGVIERLKQRGRAVLSSAEVNDLMTRDNPDTTFSQFTGQPVDEEDTNAAEG